MWGSAGIKTMAFSSVSSSVALPSSSSRHLRRSRLPSFSVPAFSSAQITPFLAGFSGNSRRRALAVASFCFGEVLSGKMASETAASAGNGSELGKVKPELLVFGTEEELSDSLARYTAELSKKFAQERGAFSIVVSGGSLIKSLRKLAESPHVESVDWNKWHVFWVDERVVPKDHPDSNYKLAYDGFLSKVPIPPGQVYAINDSLSAEGAAEDYETCMKQLVKTSILGFSMVSGFPKFDLMLLGMGPDGHVASLFPDHPLLQENSKWVAFIKDSPKPPPERITFTFPVINSSSNIALVATGAGKAGPVQRALGAGSTSSDKLPIEMVSLKDGKLTWFADKEAASKLETSASL